MLRFYTADLAHDITFGTGNEPPRPVLRPRARITADTALAADPDCDPAESDTIYDSGIQPRRQVRFVSNETQGVLKHAQVMQMIALYEAGAAFKIDTDLLVAIGAASVTYNALWEPGTTPEFSPAANGQRYYVDLLVRMREA
jgi:hypothetical protein